MLQPKYNVKHKYVKKLYGWIGMSFRGFFEPFVKTIENAFDQFSTSFSLVRDNSVSNKITSFYQKNHSDGNYTFSIIFLRRDALKKLTEPSL